MQRDRHLASGDLSRESAPLGQGSRASQHGLDFCEVLALLKSAAITSTLRPASAAILSASVCRRSTLRATIAALGRAVGVDGADAGRRAGDQREPLGVLAHLSVS
jgi:hypothetical protein